MEEIPQKKKKMTQMVLSFPSAQSSSTAQISSSMAINQSSVATVQKGTSLTATTSDKSSTIVPSDLSLTPHDPPYQPTLNKYPETTLGSAGFTKKRSFSKIWYKYVWLEYSIQADAVFCQPCRFFGKGDGETFTRTGFRNWKKIGEKCVKHESSFLHRSSVEELKNIQITWIRGSVVEQIDPSSEKSIESNRKILKVIIDVLLFCAKQELPLRGHREGVDELNRGNFLELIQFLFKYCPDIQKKFNSLPHNAKMTSPQIQNELLEATMSLLIKQIKEEVVKADYFAILADECKDESKREIIGVSLRYIHKAKVYERAVAFIETKDLSAAAIASQIVDAISSMQLKPDRCVGFSFDGANVMSGNTGGVQALLKRTFTNGIYIHCHSHRLNLVLCAAAKSETVFKDMFDVLDKLTTFFSGSKRHAKFMEMQRELRPNEQARELVHTSDVRWTSRSALSDKVLLLFGVILKCLEHFQSDKDIDTRTTAIGLYHQLSTKQFLFLLVTFNRIFQATDQVTRALQKQNLTADVAIDLVNICKETLTNFRTNDDLGYGQTLKLTNDLATEYDIETITLRPKRRKKIPARMESSVIEETCGERDEDFKRFWYAIMDNVIGELEARFGDVQNGLLPCVQACLPESPNFMDVKELSQACKLANVILDESSAVTFKKFIERRSSREDLHFGCLADVFELIDEDIFPEIHKLYKFLMTLPSTSCTVERMFSTMNRIKTKSRKSMLTTRLSNLSLISFENELTSGLDYDKIIDIFKKNSRRLLF